MAIWTMVFHRATLSLWHYGHFEKNAVASKDCNNLAVILTERIQAAGHLQTHVRVLMPVY